MTTLQRGSRTTINSPFTSSSPQMALKPGVIMTPSTSPYGRGLIQTPTKDIAPRVGFAWQPYGQNKMVVRGGYGLYYTPEISNAPFSMAEGAQAQSGASLLGNVKGQLPNLTFDNPFPGVTSGGPLTYPFANALDQNMQDQQTMQYNLIIQTQRCPPKYRRRLDT